MIYTRNKQSFKTKLQKVQTSKSSFNSNKNLLETLKKRIQGGGADVKISDQNVHDNNIIVKDVVETTGIKRHDELLKNKSSNKVKISKVKDLSSSSSSSYLSSHSSSSASLNSKNSNKNNNNNNSKLLNNNAVNTALSPLQLALGLGQGSASLSLKQPLSPPQSVALSPSSYKQQQQKQQSKRILNNPNSNNNDGLNPKITNNLNHQSQPQPKNPSTVPQNNGDFYSPSSSIIDGSPIQRLLTPSNNERREGDQQKSYNKQRQVNNYISGDDDNNYNSFNPRNDQNLLLRSFNQTNGDDDQQVEQQHNQHHHQQRQHSKQPPQPTCYSKQIYISMLQNQITLHKHKLQTQACIHTKQSKQTEQKLSLKTQQFIQKLSTLQAANHKLSKNLNEYYRFYTIGRNTLITCSMELIQLKNQIKMQMYLQSDIRSGVGGDKVTKVTKDSLKGKNNLSITNHHQKQNNWMITTQQQANKQYNDRVYSINKCLAKAQKVIETYGKILNSQHSYYSSSTTATASFNEYLQCNTNKNTNTNMNTNSVSSLQPSYTQLKQIQTYQNKIIQKLQNDIRQLNEKQQQKKGDNNSINDSIINPNNIKDFTTIHQTNKPYSFIDQIKLLKHQISRLTHENCSLVSRISELQIRGGVGLKDDDDDQERRRITTNKGEQQDDKHNDNNGMIMIDSATNSKLQYWVGGKNDENGDDQNQNNYRNINEHEHEHVHEHGNIPIPSQLQQTSQVISFINKQEFSTLIGQFKKSLFKKGQRVNENDVNEVDVDQIQQQLVDNHKLSQQQKHQQQQHHQQQQQLQLLQQKQTKIKTLQNQLYKINIQKQFLLTQLQRVQKQSEQKCEQFIKKIRLMQSDKMVKKVANEGGVKKSNDMGKEQQEGQGQGIINNTTTTTKTTLVVQNNVISIKQNCQKLQFQNKELINEVIMLKKQLKLKVKNAADERGSEIVSTPPKTIEQLFAYLKSVSASHHRVLLEMVQKYERKIALMHEEVALAKCALADIMSMATRLKDKAAEAAVAVDSDNLHSGNNHIVAINKLLSQFFAMELAKTSNMSETSSFNSKYKNRLDYYLMMIKSLAIGISRKDIQLIEQELSDYLVQLKGRLPTVDEVGEWDQEQSQ